MGQTVQSPTDVEPTAEVDPTEQAVQSKDEELPVLELYVLAGQLVQLVELSEELKVPAGQTTHAPVPST